MQSVVSESSCTLNADPNPLELDLDEEDTTAFASLATDVISVGVDSIPSDDADLVTVAEDDDITERSVIFAPSPAAATNHGAGTATATRYLLCLSDHPKQDNPLTSM